MTYRLFSLLAICFLPLICGTHSFSNSSSTHISAAAANFEELFERDSVIMEVDTFTFSLPDSVDQEAVYDFSTRSIPFDSLFSKYVHTHQFSGTVLLAEKGKIIHAGGYGYANDKTYEPIELESVFQLASVSKTITAAAIMLLYEDGKLDFNDKVSKHIENWPYKRMRIRHLLHHRSGLPRYDALSNEYWDKRYFMNYADVLELYIGRKPGLFFNPGRQFDYSNSNYAVLAALVDFIAMKPFEEFVQERIFDPLRMETAYYVNHLDRLKKENHTVGYVKKGRRFKVAGGDHVDGVMGDKGLHATVKDLFLFDQALYGEKLLKAETLKKAFTPGSSLRRTQNYGFGFRMKSYNLGMVYHFGWWRGYKTCFIRDMKNQRTMIVLSNRDYPGRSLNYWRIFSYLKKWNA